MLTRQTIFITGANRGIGLGFVKAYLNNHDSVIATCRNPKDALELNKLLAEFPDTLKVETLDVCCKEDFTRIIKSYSSISCDILINNAGVYPEEHSRHGILQCDIEDIKLAFDTNLIGAVYAIQSLLPLLLKSQNPKIINLSSQMGAISCANGFGYSYRISKASLNMLTAAFALECKDVVTIALRPGWVKTQMGGDRAQISVDESVTKMIAIINNLAKEDSGGFFDINKERCNW